MSLNNSHLKLPAMIFSVIAGGIAGYILCFVTSGLLYPHSESSHAEPKPTNILFRLFFDYNSSTGYHAEPSFFSMVFFTIVGMLAGWVLGRRIILLFPKKVSQ